MFVMMHVIRRPLHSHSKVGERFYGSTALFLTREQYTAETSIHVFECWAVLLKYEAMPFGDA